MSKKTKKAMSMLFVVTLIAVIAVGGMLAYLQDSDSDVNVMTLGNVDIEQFEQQRGENGLEPFEDDKPLFPAVFEGSSINWAPEDKWVVPGNQAWKVVADNENVVDKFVTVKNTGKSDAYVRTIIAYEGDATYGPEGAYIHVVHNGNNVDPAIAIDCIGTVKIDGVDYTVYEYVYPKALASGETSIPSLKQIYMNKAADNDVVAKYGEKYEVLVLSQATQTNGFANAQIALDTAFGETNETNVIEWFGEVLKTPFAKVTVLGKNDTLTNKAGNVTVLDKNLTIDTTDSKMGLDVGKIPLNTAYQFEPTMTYEEGAASEYADWHADFVVSVDKDIPAYGIGLAGYYDAWCSLNNDKWVMLASDASIPAGTEIRLVDAMGSGNITVSYEELCNYGNDGIGFLCGAVALDGKTIGSDQINAKLDPGTTLTVELRLYEATGGSKTTETGNYITTGTYTYTFN